MSVLSFAAAPPGRSKTSRSERGKECSCKRGHWRASCQMWRHKFAFAAGFGFDLVAGLTVVACGDSLPSRVPASGFSTRKASVRDLPSIVALKRRQHLGRVPEAVTCNYGPNTYWPTQLRMIWHCQTISLPNSAELWHACSRPGHGRKSRLGVAWWKG